MKMSKKLLIPAILIAALLISTVYGAYLSYKAYVEIYGTKYPLGMVELDVGKLAPIEGLEAREDYLGVMRVWTYSNDAQLVVQLAQLSQIITNFRSFTVKVCLPLDVVFVVDLTGSMIDYMPEIKTELLDLMWVLNTMNKCPNRFGIVGFYDYPFETYTVPLTDDYPAIETEILGLTAGGGGLLPQGHWAGLTAAKELFDTAAPSSLTHDKIVVFLSDAESGFNDLPEFTNAMNAAWALAEMGVKIHSVLLWGDSVFNPTEPNPDALPQLQYYSAISNGNFVLAKLGEVRFVPGVTSNPTWIVKLTPITPFDSFRLKVASLLHGTETDQLDRPTFYTFSIWVDFFCKAVPWDEFFVTELMANLEKAEIPPYLPPPPLETPEPPPPIGVSLFADPIVISYEGSITFDWTIDSPPGVTPVLVTLTVFPPVGDSADIFTGSTFPDDLVGSFMWTHDPLIGPDGPWSAMVTYEYMYEGVTFYAGAFASFTVNPA